MIQNEHTIPITLADSYHAAARVFEAPAHRRAILYLHGIQSHSGWYINSAKHLMQNGCTVLMPDRRGAGLNQTDRGHAQSAWQLISDTAIATGHLCQLTSSDKIDIIAVSWGAKLALAYAAKYPTMVRSITLVAPGLCPKIDISLKEKIAVGIHGIINPRKLHPIPLNEPSLFTANPARLEYIANDPLMLRHATASFFIASKMLDFMAKAAVSKIKAPLYLFLAEQDRIIDNLATIECLEPALSRCEIYCNAHHTLEFEQDPAAFLARLVKNIIQ